MRFKINKRSLGQLKRNLSKDVGERMQYDMREEFSLLPTFYYDCSDKKDSIIYDEVSHVVGSEEWAVAASDTGSDWKWKKTPNLDRLTIWAIRHGPPEFARENEAIPFNKQKPALRSYVRFVAEQIMKNGIESNYWVDLYLGDFVNATGARGSGVI